MNISLYKNGSLLNSSTTGFVTYTETSWNVGVYNISCNTTGNQNYSLNTVFHILNIINQSNNETQETTANKDYDLMIFNNTGFIIIKTTKDNHPISNMKIRIYYNNETLIYQNYTNSQGELIFYYNKTGWYKIKSSKSGYKTKQTFIYLQIINQTNENQTNTNQTNNQTITNQSNNQSNQFCSDIDNDNADECFTDSNNDNNYESYNDSNNNTIIYNTVDGDNDNNTDYLIDTNDDGEPDVYIDPDDEIITDIIPGDYDNDGNTEYGLDTDGDGDIDMTLMMEMFMFIFQNNLKQIKRKKLKRQPIMNLLLIIPKIILQIL